MAYKDLEKQRAAQRRLYAKQQGLKDSKSLRILNSVLPLNPDATFEELMEVANKVRGGNKYYPTLEKAIKAHPAYKKVVADLNTGEVGRNYTFLKKPDVNLGMVNKIYKEVKERTDKGAKILEGIYKRAGDDPVKLLNEWNKLELKAFGAKMALTKKIKSLPQYKDFLEADKGGFIPRTGKEKSLNPTREFLRFATYIKTMGNFPEGAKLSDYITLPELEKRVGKTIVTPEKTGSGRERYRLFDYNQITKYLGDPIRDEKKNRYFNRPTNEQLTKLTRFFKEGTYLYGENTEDIVKAIHNNEGLRKMLSAKNFPELGEFKPELEKVLGKEITDAQTAHGTRVYSDWTKGTLFKNMGLDIKPSGAEVKLGNKIYNELEGFKRNNKWAQGEYLHAMREIKKNMPKEAGSLTSFKTYMSKYLPEGFLKKKNLNVNEIFSIKATARNKAFPYAYFVDVIDADINQKNLATFQSKLSTALNDTRDLISRLRAGDKTVKYTDLENRILKFQKQRKTFGDTIKKNFPGKNFNLADIVLGTEKEILNQDFDIADKIYSSKNLNKWKQQGIDIAQHAKTEGFAMTGADKKTAFLFRDLVNTSKQLFNSASAPEQYEIAFKLGCVGSNADGGRIGYALGTGTVQCVNRKLSSENHLPKLTQLDESTPLLGKMKNMAFNVFKSPGLKRFTLAGVAGAGIQQVVKQFNNNDPTSYLSNEDQQKNMLVSMATEPIAPDFERPAILDYQLPAVGATLAAGTALAAPSTIKASRSRGLGVEKKGVARTAARVLGRGLGVAAAPALLAPLAGMDLASQIAEGDSAADIATNPFNYLYPAFADQTDRLTRGLNPTLRKLARLNLGKAALRGISRGGIAGLGLSLGIEGMKLLDD